MGWASAGEIFGTIAKMCADAVSAGAFNESTAEQMLHTLIVQLQEGDWDTEDESLAEFSDVPFIVRAFARAGVRKYIDLTDHTDVANLLTGLLDPYTDWIGTGAFVENATLAIVHAAENQ